MLTKTASAGGFGDKSQHTALLSRAGMSSAVSALVPPTSALRHPAKPDSMGNPFPRQRNLGRATDTDCRKRQSPPIFALWHDVSESQRRIGDHSGAAIRLTESSPLSRAPAF